MRSILVNNLFVCSMMLFGSAFGIPADAADMPVVVLETTMGNIEVELNDEKAPLSVANFMSYVDSQFYNGTIIHRVVPNFVIQGGGLLSDLKEKATNAPIASEATNGLSNLKGTLGMARDTDINSATSQFYINTVDNVRLDHDPVNPARYGYAVFGKVVTGMDVVAAIALVSTMTVGEYEGVPVNAITLTSVRRK